MIVTQQQTQPTTIGRLAGVIIYPAALVIAEGAIIAGYPVTGAVVHALVFVLLLVNSAVVSSERWACLLTVLTLVPLTRLLSLLIPLSNYPQDTWYIIVGVPLFAATLIAAHAVGITLEDVGMARLSTGTVLRQGIVGLFGIVVAFIQYAILRPVPMPGAASPGHLLLISATLFVFTGVLEEVIFRGVIQRAAIRVFGGWGILYTAVISLILVIGYQSIPQLALAFGTALAFGVLASRTRSILGVSLAHGLANVLLFVVFPHILSITLPPLVLR